MSEIVTTGLGCLVGAVVVLAARWAPLSDAREVVLRFIAPAVAVVTGMSVARLDGVVLLQLACVMLACLAAGWLGMKWDRVAQDRNKRTTLRIMEEERRKAG